MALIEFYKTGDVFIDQHEAWLILKWFFGGNAGLSPADITYNDRSFAQALMFEAIRKSKKISFIQGLWESTIMPPAKITDLLKEIAKLTAKSLWEHLKPEDLKNPEIYKMVKDQLTRNWRSPWQIRVNGGGAVY